MKSIRYTINWGDVVSTLRNWAIVNGVMLLAYFNQIRDMFVEWNFDFIAMREIFFISLFSLMAFFIKRYFIGEKK
ncbi:MAG: hypothetical protein K9L99_05835 [Candidatus Omnitrophica bacterium]|nr:hypothetical protein [Candidatus Omnitrophota bacterium]